MYAIIRTGGKQYRVAPDDVITVERLPGEAGDTVTLSEVLLVGGEGGPKTGAPLVAGASVSATLVQQARGKKLIVFKKKRRQNYRRRNGHRQDLSILKITQISAGE
jgi:large subunit ribosomal protein L21